MEERMPSLSSRQVPIEGGLFTWPSDSPQLIATRCKDCSVVTFPQQKSCPDCGGQAVEEILLSRRGTIWTWTIQNFPPPSPPYKGNTDRKTFVPYGVAYLDLPEGVRVEARLTENDPEKLEIGQEMELVIEKFQDDADGNELMTFAFQPIPD
jgi:uncharacterized OB-fold protein